MTQYAWLIFDADGTLFDFEHAEAMALTNTPRQLNLAVPAVFSQAYHRINNGLWKRFEAGELLAHDIRRERFSQLFEELELAGDSHAFGEAFLDNLVNETMFLEGAEALINHLKGSYRLAILTNGFASVQHARISRLGLRDLFHPIIISEEVGAAKPDAAVFDIALRKMGDPDKDKVLMIGDSLESDIHGGSNAGIDTCWFNPSSQPNPTSIHPTYEIQRLHELHALLGARD